MTTLTQSMIEDALSVINTTIAMHKNPLVAYSGGKDALVTMHLVQQVRPSTKGVCEMSFLFERQADDIRNTVAKHGWDVDFVEHLNWDWIRKHPQLLFEADVKGRGKRHFQRQQTSVRLYAQRNNHDLVIFGRRTQENKVPAMVYDRKGVTQFHPIRNWTRDQVWEYLEMVGIPQPWIYSQRFGQLAGNAPFYALRTTWTGSVEESWRQVTELDPKINKERLYGNF